MSSLIYQNQLARALNTAVDWEGEAAIALARPK